MTLPVRIRSWREYRGLTQAALARKMAEVDPDHRGVTPEAISQWESAGKHATTPSVRNLDLLVVALDLTHEQFYGPVPASPTTAPSTAA